MLKGSIFLLPLYAIMSYACGDGGGGEGVGLWSRDKTVVSGIILNSSIFLHDRNLLEPQQLPFWQDNKTQTQTAQSLLRLFF